MPFEVVRPSPEVTCPSGFLGSNGPNMKVARRPMALPASTFSLTASSVKCSGRDDADFTGFHIGIRDDAPHSAKMIHMVHLLGEGLFVFIPGRVPAATTFWTERTL